MTTQTTQTTQTTGTTRTFRLPDVGEGLTEADIVAWRVAVGDPVAVNQCIVEIETAKSIVELPSPYAGRVVELLAPQGATVAVGAPIITVEVGGSSGPDAAPSSPSSPSTMTATSAASASGDDQGDDAPRPLVGYGTTAVDRPRRRRDTGPAVGGRRPPSGEHGGRSPSADGRGSPARAKPPVRRLAKDLGVDLASIPPTGPNGTVSRQDVLVAAEAAPSQTRPVDPGYRSPAAAPQRIPVRGLRKHTASAMVASAFTAPHVTEFVTVDVTRTLDLLGTVQGMRQYREVRITPLALVARAYLKALSRTPVATGRWDEAAQEIVVPAGVNLGIAVATPRGLLVPNVKDAHLLGLGPLAAAIAEVAETARAGRTRPESMAGGSTTITNIGVFGIDSGTPILNPGETAILALGAIRRRPWVVQDAAGERIEPRSIVQLALSFDHRVLDGQEGSQLLSDTAALLAEPGLALL